ncbi:ricin B-like lectin [Irpex lacteus]|nr:ricin B-like lectin [Irpex lacteus]
MAPLEDGVYFIKNVGTGTVLDLEKGTADNGTRVIGHAKRELNDQWVPIQLWVVAKTGNGDYYTVQNAKSLTYMTLTDGLAASGTPIVGHERSGDNQHWQFTRNTANTAFVIKNEASGTYVDLYNGGFTDGTAVNGWPGSGASTTNTHQLWELVRA